MRQGQYNYMVNPDGSEALLYDLVKDPSETTNLFDSEPSLASDVAKALGQWPTTLATSSIAQ
ncbi:MAG: hypothetical protein P8L78_11385 [Mariniblastus sp.]|nr:hypothetical protein [Mariniblastus sp.]MDG2182288.1 hypothetical protein [Mariniblastus sp.]